MAKKKKNTTKAQKRNPSSKKKLMAKAAVPKKAGEKVKKTAVKKKSSLKKTSTAGKAVVKSATKPARQQVGVKPKALPLKKAVLKRSGAKVKKGKKSEQKSGLDDLQGRSVVEEEALKLVDKKKSPKSKETKKKAVKQEQITESDQSSAMKTKSKKEEKESRPGELEEVLLEAEVFVEEEVDNGEKAPEEVILTDAEGRRYCRRRDCDQLAMVEGYCRYHYLLFWKKIQQRKKILSDGKLIHYIEELTSRYPDKYLEMIRRDLRTEKDFMAAIQELEIDESGTEEGDFEEDNSIIDEVRGMSEPHSREDEDF